MLHKCLTMHGLVPRLKHLDKNQQRVHFLFLKTTTNNINNIMMKMILRYIL